MDGAAVLAFAPVVIDAIPAPPFAMALQAETADPIAGQKRSADDLDGERGTTEVRSGTNLAVVNYPPQSMSESC